MESYTTSHSTLHTCFTVDLSYQKNYSECLHKKPFTIFYNPLVVQVNT